MKKSLFFLAVLFAIFILSCDSGNRESEDTVILQSTGSGSVKTPSMRDITINADGGTRSAADIMKVVRQRTPGIKHLYSKFLQKKDFEGTVKLKFTIAPGGQIISISTVSSNTGFSEFDSEIKNAVSRWTFSKVKSGNTTVTIPFKFSKN